MDIQIVEAHERNLTSKQVADFYAKHWKNKTALAIPEFMSYQFAGSPTDPGVNHCVVAIDDDSGQLYGVMGLNQRPFYIKGKEVPGAEISSWIVDESLQGHGIGKRILERLVQPYEAIVGMGISAMAIPLYLRAGFRFLHAIPRFVRVFNFANVSKFAATELLGEKLIGQWSNLPQAKFEARAATPEGSDAAFDAAITQSNGYTKRPEYLAWRYTNHPTFEYRQFVVNGLYVCLREELTLDGLRLLHVIDCFGDLNEVPAVLAFVEDYARQNAFDLADCFALNSQLNCHLYAGGWFSTMDDRCFQFAHLFHPYELRTPPTTSMCFWSKHDMAEIANFGKLSICKGDCDLDRPTFSTFKAMNS